LNGQHLPTGLHLLTWLHHTAARWISLQADLCAGNDRVSRAKVREMARDNFVDGTIEASRFIGQFGPNFFVGQTLDAVGCRLD
jgi:hypothetical protein